MGGAEAHLSTPFPLGSLGVTPGEEPFILKLLYETLNGLPSRLSRDFGGFPLPGHGGGSRPTGRVSSARGIPPSMGHTLPRGQDTCGSKPAWRWVL